MVWERGVVVKTAEEIEIMRAAGRINALALDTVRKYDPTWNHDCGLGCCCRRSNSQS